MSHVRNQIRDAFRTRLTGLATTGANVVATRLHPFLQEDAELPGLSVWTSSETIREPGEDTEIGTQHRSLPVIVEGFAEETASKTVDDILDDIAAEAETSVYTDQSFGGLVLETFLESTEFDFDASLSKNVGQVTLTFRVEYLTREGSPEQTA